MRRFGRPPVSRMEPKYSQQNEVREALSNWAFRQKSFRDAARKLNCSYKSLGNYRHGARWIPDDIVKKFGFDPQVFKNRLNAEYETRIYSGRSVMRQRGAVVSAAIHFVQSFSDPEKLPMRLELRGELIRAVETYIHGSV